MAIKTYKKCFFPNTIVSPSSHFVTFEIIWFAQFSCAIRNVTLCETFIGSDVQSTSLSYFPKIIVTTSSAENSWLDQEKTGILASSLYAEPSGTSRFSVSLASGFL